VRAAIPVAALALIAATLAGCSSGSLSTPVLRSRATAICRRAAERAAELPSPPTTAQAQAFLTRGAAVLAAELRSLDGLDAGGRAAPPYRRALAAGTDELAVLRSAARAITHGDDPVGAYQALQVRLAPLEDQARDAWATLQISACLMPANTGK
jgi:hypothetical protein